MPKDDLPDSAFAPPPEQMQDAPLELDAAWVAERAAKQAAAANPPKPKRRIAGVIVAILLVAGVAAAVAWIVLKG